MFENEDFAFTGDTGDLQVLHNDERLTELAELFPNVNSILIPKKAEYNLRKYASKALLREIDPNTDVAVEKYLLLLSNLASTLYVEDKENPENRWKYLKAEIFHQQTKNRDNTYIYPKIIDALVAGTSKGTMLEVDSNYAPNEYSRRYRIPESYYKAGLIEYLIKDSGIIENRNKIYYEQLGDAVEHLICRNLIKMYPKLELPTKKELLAIGKQLAKKGLPNKKGKIPTMRNKHKNEYWKDYKNRSFIEDNIEIFQYLTNRGFMIPSAGDERSGGRVVDSFTLMPSWIRREITIDGKKLVECDYRALHPNIAMKLYYGIQGFLTHEIVAKKAGIDKDEVKVEHLGFFNKNWHSMMESPLFDYYSKHEADMLSRIFHDKKEHGHKITSQKMFAVEVAIMTDVITYLNSVGIHVLYVYDALLCEEKDKAVVVETMNRIVLEHGVKTTVKDNASAKIEVVTAIADEVDEETDTKRITLDEFFRRVSIRHGSVISETSLDIHYKVLSKHFEYVDEVIEDYRQASKVEIRIDGGYKHINLFE